MAGALKSSWLVIKRSPESNQLVDKYNTSEGWVKRLIVLSPPPYQTIPSSFIKRAFIACSISARIRRGIVAQSWKDSSETPCVSSIHNRRCRRHCEAARRVTVHSPPFLSNSDGGIKWDFVLVSKSRTKKKRSPSRPRDNHNPELPPTNNEAERALRHAVIGRRISYGTRTSEGSLAYSSLLSVIETCRLRNINPWIYICEVITLGRKGLPPPSVPTGWPSSSDSLSVVENKNQHGYFEVRMIGIRTWFSSLNREQIPIYFPIRIA